MVVSTSIHLAQTIAQGDMKRIRLLSIKYDMDVIHGVVMRRVRGHRVSGPLRATSPEVGNCSVKYGVDLGGIITLMKHGLQ